MIEISDWERVASFGHGGESQLVRRRCFPYTAIIGYSATQNMKFDWIIVDHLCSQVEVSNKTYSSCGNAKRAATLRLKRLARIFYEQQIFGVW